MANPKDQHHRNPKSLEKCQEAKDSYKSACDGMKDMVIQFSDIQKLLLNLKDKEA